MWFFYVIHFLFLAIKFIIPRLLNINLFIQVTMKESKFFIKMKNFPLFCAAKVKIVLIISNLATRAKVSLKSMLDYCKYLFAISLALNFYTVPSSLYLFL